MPEAARSALASSSAVEHAVELRGERAAEWRYLAGAVQVGVLGHRRGLERAAAGQRLEGDHGQRVEIRRRSGRARVIPLLGRDVRRRPEREVVRGEHAAQRRPVRIGHRRLARAEELREAAIAAGELTAIAALNGWSIAEALKMVSVRDELFYLHEGHP
jgi:hypothetical protein